MRVKQYISKLDYQLRVINWRKRIGKQILEDSLVHGQLVPLTKEQVEAVDRVWGSRKKLFDWRWFELYNWEHPEVGVNIWKFIPVDYWITYIDPMFTQPLAAPVFDDKNMYSLYFPDVRQPQTVVRLMNGLFLDDNYRIITEKEALSACVDAGQIVLKPTTVTSGGFGILFWDRDNDSVDILQQVFSSNRSYIVQAVVRQHPVMALLNESSCNTMRILSLIHDGEITVFPTSFVRFGGKGSRVDNVSSGGFCAAVNENGEIIGYARNHHETRIDVPHGVIPNYNKCLDIVRCNTPRMAHVTNLVAWDFAIAEDGEPVLLEINIARTSIQSFQALWGPILGDYVEWFLQQVPVRQGSNNQLSRCIMNILSKLDG